MRVAFKPLFRVRLRHSFYASGTSTGDFVVEPAPATRRALSDHGLVYRRLADGWAVYGEVDPGSAPATLLRPLGDGVLRLAFLLRPANPYLWNISDLPAYRTGKSVFYFNNLRDDQQADRLYLGDSVAGARVGEALPLVAGESLTWHFKDPVNAAELGLTDLFNNTLATFSVAPDPSARASEHRLDLARVETLVPGRYTLSDDHGKSQAFYYDPEIFAGRPFGVVEIFSRTDTLTPDASDLVPAAYRFLTGDELTGIAEYTLQLESRSTKWRYNVIKKYDSNGLSPENLSISDDAGAVTFDKSTIDSDLAIFTSTDAVPLAESRRELELEHQSNKIRKLPEPAAATPLAKGAEPGSYVSEMYVYV